MIRIPRINLYWEDITERLIFAELDDYAWKLPERLFGYKKDFSLYIYRNCRLSAFYSESDSQKEAGIGYDVYRNPKKILKVIALKKKIFKQVRAFKKKSSKVNVKKLSDEDLKKLVLESVNIYHKALSVHYLTQPQFFEKFESVGSKKNREKIKKLAHYRFTRTRVAWTEALKIAQQFLHENGRRIGLSSAQSESFLMEELEIGLTPLKSEIKKREKLFVLLSHHHQIRLITGKKASAYIRKYDSHKGTSQVKGIIGSKGKVRGKAFVVKNESLDFKKLPKGMTKGSILIVQNAWPEFDLYYKYARAIVTNEGGITSHGVVVAREYGIPCIVGTRIATKIFRTGEMVEVDAERGTVRKI